MKILLLFGITVNNYEISEETFNFREFFNCKKAIEESNEHNKLTLLYFSAIGSVHCDRMKETIFRDPEIKKLLTNKFCSFKALVDDPGLLTKEEQYISKLNKNLILTKGKQSSEIQLLLFETNIQPYFVIMDGKGKKIRQLVGKTNKVDFLKFLNGKIN